MVSTQAPSFKMELLHKRIGISISGGVVQYYDEKISGGSRKEKTNAWILATSKRADFSSLQQKIHALLRAFSRRAKNKKRGGYWNRIVLFK